MSGRPPGVKAGDRVRITTVHTGTITRIDDDSFVLETGPGRPMHGNFHGDGEMTWEILGQPEPPVGSVVLDTDGLAWQRASIAAEVAASWAVGWWRLSGGEVLGVSWDALNDDRGPITVIYEGDGRSDVEPLATDEQRLAAGWLDPAGAESLWDEREEARARLNEVSNDRLAQLRRFAAQQPVIDAARAWRASRSLVEEYNMDDDEIRLEAAVNALDAVEAEPC